MYGRFNVSHNIFYFVRAYALTKDEKYGSLLETC